MSNYLEHWYAALSSKYGVIVLTSDPVKLRERLYQARKEALDIELSNIAICTSPTNPQQELWLVKKKITGEPDAS